MMGLYFFSKLDWGSYMISIAKTVSKEIRVLIHSMKFISPEVILYLYKYTMRHFIECCCYIWVGSAMCYLYVVDKLHRRLCRTVGPTLAASLKPLGNCRNVASLILLYRYYFGGCSFDLTKPVPIPCSRRRSTRFSDRLHDFSVNVPKCYKIAYVNSFSLCTARFWNSLSPKWFPLTYDLNSRRSRVNRRVLSLGSFKTFFLFFFLSFSSFYFNSIPRSDTSSLHE